MQSLDDIADTLAVDADALTGDCQRPISGFDLGHRLWHRSHIETATHAALRALQVSGLDTYLPLSRSVPDALSSIDVAADASR